ncbi:MAG: DUF4912 domain-containing protein [Nitrospirota bacterium]
MPSKRSRTTAPSSRPKTAARAPKKAPTTRGVRGGSTSKPSAAPPARKPATPAPAVKTSSRAVGPRRADLMAQAKAAGITGRQRMTVAQLQAALARVATRPTPAPTPDAQIRPVVVATPSPVAGLPWRFGVTEVVALPVDPLLVYVYWELLPDDVAAVRAALGSSWDGAQQVLRAYEVSPAFAPTGDGIGLAARARHHFDSDVGGDVGSYYVHLWSPDQTLVFELGWRGRTGRFVAAARSNLVRTPRNAPCGGEERWMTVRNGRIVTTPAGAVPGGDAADRGPESVEPAPWSATFPTHRGWGGRR